VTLDGVEIVTSIVASFSDIFQGFKMDFSVQILCTVLFEPELQLYLPVKVGTFICQWIASEMGFPKMWQHCFVSCSVWPLEGVKIDLSFLFSFYCSVLFKPELLPYLTVKVGTFICQWIANEMSFPKIWQHCLIA